MSDLDGGWDVILDLSVRERMEPKMDEALEGADDGMGESPSSYILVAVVGVEEKVFVDDDILGRERSRVVSPGLRKRLSGTDADWK